MRTIVDVARMAGYDGVSTASAEASQHGTKHDALDDCLRQAAVISEAFQYLRNASSPLGKERCRSALARNDDLSHRIRFLLREMQRANAKLPCEDGYYQLVADDGEFTFPDGETWYPLGEDET